MTHVTNNVLALRTSNNTATSIQPVTPSAPATKAQCSARPDSILRHLHDPGTKSAKALYGHQTFTLTYNFWHTLLSAIDNGTLTLDLISERPSDLPNGQLWLSYERITALFAEQKVQYANISPVLLHIIMGKTNFLYPGALIHEGRIESEQSFVYDGNGGCQGEHRYCFCIQLNCLPISANHTAE